MDKSKVSDEVPSASTNDDEQVHHSAEKELILNEVEMHVEAIQSLVQGHGNLQTSGPFPAISHHIEKIQQLIREENSTVQSSLSPLVQQSMDDDPAKEVSVFDNNSPCFKALNNSVVLRTIMDYLETKDLFRLRLVAKNWEEEATVQLLSSRRIHREREKRPYQRHKIIFKWDAGSLKFRSKVGTLDEFMDNCLGNPVRKFPCSAFHFENVTTDLEVKDIPADLSNFLTKYGNHVKTLDLQSSRNSISSLEMLRKIIFESTPNLEFLALNVDLYQDEVPTDTQGVVTRSKSKAKSKASSNSNEAKLPKYSLGHLKELFVTCEIPSSYSQGFQEPPHNSSAAERCGLLITDILSSAPNLTLISDENLWFTKEIKASGKIGTVRKVEWGYSSATKMSHFTEFSQAGSQLTSLYVTPEIRDYRFDEKYSSLSSILPNLLLILQSSRSTLKTLGLSGRLAVPTGTFWRDVPVMEKVEEFTVVGWSGFEGEHQQGMIVPQGFTLQGLFPRLKKLDLMGVQESKDEDNPFVKDCNRSTTVESLDIGQDSEDNFNPEWLSQAIVLYPNVRRLDLGLVWDWYRLPEILGAIWRSWNSSQLEELAITVYDDDDDDDQSHNFTEMMDQALTGFNRGLCRRLLYGVGSSNKVEEFERGPSILDMKNLKLLKLFADGSQWASYPLFSRVSMIHAFEPMKRRLNLKVIFDGKEL